MPAVQATADRQPATPARRARPPTKHGASIYTELNCVCPCRLAPAGCHATISRNILHVLLPLMLQYAPQVLRPQRAVSFKPRDPSSLSVQRALGRAINASQQGGDVPKWLRNLVDAGSCLRCFVDVGLGPAWIQVWCCRARELIPLQWG